MIIAILSGLCLQRVISTIYMREFGKKKLFTFLPQILSDFISLCICFGFVREIGFQSKRYAFLIFCSTIFYKIQGFLSLKFSSNISPLCYFICFQARMIFLAIMNVLFLKKKYTKIQILGLTFILSSFVAQYFSKAKAVSDKEERSNEIISIAAIVSAGFCSVMGGLVFEKYLRNKVKSFRRYMVDYSMIGMVNSILFTMIEYFTMAHEGITNTLKEKCFYLVALFFSMEGQIQAYLSTKLDPVKRTFYSQIVALIANLIVQIKEKSSITLYDLLSIVLLIIGTLTYDYKAWIHIFEKEKEIIIPTNEITPQKIIVETLK